ncbi:MULTISPECIES: DUF6265 family protein [Sphingomonas]
MAMAILGASKSASATQVADLSWMAGHWLECSPRGEAAETWTDDRGGVMLGISKSIRNGRTSWEWSRIDRTPEGIAFLASPQGQQPTAFKAVAIAKGKAVFENLDHDFPQRVIYIRKGDNLTGRIEGIAEGKQRAAEWHYRLSPLNATCPADPLLDKPLH